MAQRRIVRVKRNSDGQALQLRPPSVDAAESTNEALSEAGAAPSASPFAGLSLTSPSGIAALPPPEANELRDSLAQAAASSADAAVDGAEQPEVITTSADFWRVQVEAVYKRRNPHKLANVKGLLEKYAGKEAVLYAKVCKNYDLDPTKLYADPKAWEDYEKDVQEEPEPSEVSGGGVAIPNLFGSTGGVSIPSLFGPGSSSLFAAPPKPDDIQASTPAALASGGSDQGCKTQ